MSTGAAELAPGPERRLSFAFARRHGVLCRAIDAERAELVVRHGADPTGVAEARRFLGRPLVLEQVSEERFEELLQRSYASGNNAAAEAAEGLEGDTDLAHLAEELPEPSDLLESEDDAPIIKLINAVLTQAVRENASDIHIEPFENRLVIRFRVDGVLREVLQSRRALAQVVVLRQAFFGDVELGHHLDARDDHLRQRPA